MNNPTTFYIVRHGESEANVGFRDGTIKTYSGSLAHGTDLTEKGISQAKERAKDLQNIKFDAAFSSDFTRAKRTAEIIAKEHELVVESLKILRERFWGSLEGWPIEKIDSEMKRLQEGLNAQQKMKFKLVEDAESNEEAAVRMVQFVREMALAYPDKTVLVVSHGDIMRRFLTKIGYVEYEELPAHSVKNTAYFVLKSDGIEFEVIKTEGIEKKTS
ncbi:MAG TPA: histidine phosphatase family protein [Patescibacteria group bacterium]